MTANNCDILFEKYVFLGVVADSSIYLEVLHSFLLTKGDAHCRNVFLNGERVVQYCYVIVLCINVM